MNRYLVVLLCIAWYATLSVGYSVCNAVTYLLTGLIYVQVLSLFLLSGRVVLNMLGNARLSGAVCAPR